MKPYDQDDTVDTASSCACSCGGQPSPGRRYVTGHNLRTLGPRSETHKQRIAAGARAAWASKRQRKPLGSRRLDANGYWLVKVREGGGRWDKEHILVVERAIGRRLTPGEQVHHINGVRTDNRLENLQLCCDGSEHQRIEATFKRLLPQLMDAGLVVYDRKTKEYRCG